jgi:hypothetical protein
LVIGYQIRGGAAAPTPQWQFNPVSRWVSQVVINGAEFPTDTYYHDLEQAMLVNDAALAARVGAELGIPFVAGDAVSLFEITHIISDALRNDLRANTLFNGGADTVVPGDRVGFPRLINYNLLVPTAPEDGYRNYLLTQVAAKAAARGLAPYAADNNRYARVAPGTGGPERIFMANVLTAIADDNETAFIDNLARFWNVWGSNNPAAKNGFMESMTLMFVTKRFSNTATQSIFFHFILNCGQIHT